MSGFWTKFGGVADQLDALAGRVILKVWNRIRPRIWAITGMKVLFSLFILFAWWLGKMAEKAASSVGSIPSYAWWWIVGIPTAIVVIVLLWKNRSTVLTPLGQVRAKFSFARVLGVLAIVGVVTLIVFNDEIKGAARGYLQDKEIGGLPILARGKPASPEATLAIIAECESGGRHWNDDGSVVTNKNKDGSIDIGRWQINSQHWERAKSMGHDVSTEEGNEAFAKVLFNKYGTDPWNSSRECWGDKIYAHYAKSFSGETVATGTIRVGRDWSSWVSVPPGQELFFQRMDDTVSFEIEIQDGDRFEFKPNFPGHKRFALIQRARFRVTDEKAEELSIWLRFSPYEIT